MPRPYPNKEAPVYKEFLIWLLIATLLAVVNWVIFYQGTANDTAGNAQGLLLHLIFSYFVFGHILAMIAIYRITLYPRLGTANQLIQTASGLFFAFIGFSIGMLNLHWFGGIVFDWLFPGNIFRFNVLDAMIYWLGVFAAISVIGIFAISYYTMRLNLKESYRIHLERERLRSELETAREMQMGLMPLQAPKITGLDISGACYPAHEVGGDFFDYIHSDKNPNQLGIAVADVSGKGMKAAMSAVMASGMLHAGAAIEHRPDQLLRLVNHPLYRKTDRRLFITMLYGALDIRNLQFSFVNAGQMPPLLLRKGNITALATEGPRIPLGMTPDVFYSPTSIRLQPGDRLLIYTDGVNEAMNPERELFGTHRLEDILLNSDNNASSEETLELIRSHITRFAGEEDPHDDITMVMITVEPLNT